MFFYPHFAFLIKKKYISDMPTRNLASFYVFIGIVIVYGVLVFLNAYVADIWLPSCPINGTFGIECFGCGTNRALIQLVKGNFVQAFELNQLIFIYLSVLFILGFQKVRSNFISNTKANHE